jgi:DNA-binding CsgD family transcriptional regulator
MSRPRGNKTSKAARAERQARALELMKTGATQDAIAELLGVSRMTFWRDLQAIEARYVAGTKEDVAAFKKSQYEALMRIESATAEGSIEPEVANALVRVRDSVARLLGLNEAEKRITAHVHGPQLDSLYLEIRQELLDLSDGDRQYALLLVREFAKSRKKPVVVDAMPLQPVGRSLTDGVPRASE